MAIESSDKPQAFQEFEHRGWEAVSGGYEQHFTRLTSQTVPATLEAAGVGPGTKVLDVCTGPGMLAAAAARLGAEVTAIDFSQAFIDIAQKNAPGAECRVGDAQALPFEQGRFDAVVCGYGIIHVPDPAKALSEMLRVLTPGGRLAASVWQAPTPENGFGLVYGAIKAHGSLDVPLPHGPDFFQFSAREKLAAALRETGFEDVEVREVEQFWQFNDISDAFGWITEGTVRARALLDAQTEAARRGIYAAIEAGMSRYASTDGGYRVPMPALVGGGGKPLR